MSGDNSNKTSAGGESTHEARMEAMAKFIHQAGVGVMMGLVRMGIDQPGAAPGGLAQYRNMQQYLLANYLNTCWMGLLGEDDDFVTSTFAAMDHKSPVCLIHLLLQVGMAVLPREPTEILMGGTGGDGGLSEAKLNIYREIYRSNLEESCEEFFVPGGVGRQGIDDVLGHNCTGKSIEEYRADWIAKGRGQDTIFSFGDGSNDDGEDEEEEEDNEDSGKKKSDDAVPSSKDKKASSKKGNKKKQDDEVVVLADVDNDDDSSWASDDEEDETSEAEFDLVAVMDSYSLPVRKRVYALKAIQKEQNDLFAQFRQEIAELELQREKTWLERFEHRRHLVSGEVEPTMEEVKESKSVIEDEEGTQQGELLKMKNDREDEDTEASADVTSTPGIPKFWLTAMKNSTEMRQYITEQDEKILELCTDITHSFLDGIPQKGFVITFSFPKENPYFSEEKLFVRCLFDQEEPLGPQGEDRVDKLEGMGQIHWKSDEVNPGLVMVEKKQRNKSGKVRTIKKQDKCPTFFQLFNPPNLSKIEDQLAALSGNQAALSAISQQLPMLQEALHQHEDEVLCLRALVIPRAGHYYTGVPMAKAAAALREAFMRGGSGGSSDDDDDYEDATSSSDEDEAAVGKKSGKRGSKKSDAKKQGKHSDPNQEECKQQ